MDKIKTSLTIVTCESNAQDINVLGARSGMNFVQIKEVLGETEVTKTWLVNEDNMHINFF